MKGKLLIVIIGVLMIFGSAAAAGMENEPPARLDKDGDSMEVSNVGEKELKNKTFYMYRVKDAVDIGGRTTKEMYNTTYPQGKGNKTDLSSFRVRVEWLLYPQLAGDLQLNGNSTLTIWTRASSSDTSTVTYELTEVDENGNETVIKSKDPTKSFETSWTTQQISLDIGSYNVSKGSSLKVTYESVGNDATDYQIAYGGEVDGGIRDTNVTLPCLDYMRVSNVHTEDSQGNSTNLFNPNAENKNITMPVNITDPFGGYDIRWVNITLEGPDGIVGDFENKSMNKTYGYFDTYKSSYESGWNYSGEPEGTYEITVRAVDRNGMIAYERTGEFENHDKYGEHSFVIGGLDNYVNLKLEDNQGNALSNTTINLKPGPDTIFRSGKTDNQGLVNFTVAEATYFISVDWQDVEVETNRSLDAREVGNRTKNDPYNLTAAIFYPEFTVLDEEDSPVDDAKVFLTHPNGTSVLPPFSTDENGNFSLYRAAEGTYSLEITWKGREVGGFEREVNWTSIDQTLIVDVYDLTVQVQDNATQPVPEALVVFSYNDTLQTAESLRTGPNGEVNTRLPGAEYLLEVHWNDAKVYEDTYLLDSSDSIQITTEIYDVAVEVTDDLGGSLPGAEVTATYTDTEREIGTETTDQNGIVTFQLASGEHRFEVDWLDTQVAEVTRTVDESNKDFEISASVYQLEIVALDNTTDHNPLSSAYISVRIDGELVDTGTTNETGSYITKLPETEVDIDIEWKGIHVYSMENYLVKNNTDEERSCSVYYLDLDVLDSQEEALENAEVNIRYAGSAIQRGTTGENGSLSTRLPVEEYVIKTSWQGIEVNETDYQMIAAQNQNQLTIDTEVYHLGLEVIDDQGQALEGAEIEFYLEDSLLFSEVTGEEGKVEIRLPTEDYHIRTSWRGFTVNETVVTMNQDIEITLEAAVYHVEFTPIDSEGETIGSAYLEILHEGTVFESAEAPVSMRVPEGEFEAKVAWQGVEVYNAEHQIDESQDIDLSCDVFYLTLSGIDSREEKVTGLTVSVYHDSLPEGQDLLTTISIDETPTERFPSGELRLQAEWRAFIVAEDVEVTLEEDKPFEIECNIYYLNVTVIDSEDESLDGANLVVKDEDGTVFVTEVTEEGIAMPALPSGTWTLDAYWMDRHVGTEDITIEKEDDEIVFEVDVHPLQATVVDSEDSPLKNAEINLFDRDENLVFSRTTNENGIIGYEQLPGGEWTLEVIWMDRNVGFRSLDLTKSEDITLETDVHNLNITVEDSDEQILKGAEISLLGSEEEMVYSRDSSEEGKVSFDQLAGGDWILEVDWQRIQVMSSNVTLNETKTITLKTDVHTLNIEVVDSESDPLDGAEIVLHGPKEELVYSRESDGEGSASFEQLPGGEWEIEVYWENQEVADVSLTLEESEEKTIETNVHNLSVVVLDNESTALKGAEVTLLDETGIPISSRETDENGTVEFSQLAENEYTLRTRYRTTHLLTNVDMENETQVNLDSSQESEVTISDYPIPFYTTNLFYAIMIMLAVAIIGIVLIARKKEVI